MDTFVDCLTPAFVAKNSPSLTATIIGTIPWLLYYSLTYFIAGVVGPKLFSYCAKKEGADLSLWKAYANSMLNAIFITPLAWQTGMHKTDIGFREVSPLSTLCCHSFLGYIIWDWILLIRYRKEWKNMSLYHLHHAAVVLGWGASVITGFGHNTVVPALLLEGTGPFTNGRWFLSQSGYKDSTLYLVNSICMFLSFFILRVVFNFFLCIQRLIIQREEFSTASVPLQILLICLYVVNLMLQLHWFKKILSGAIALLRPKKAA